MVLRFPLGRGDALPETRLEGERCYLRPPRDRDWKGWAMLRDASRAFLAPWEPVWPVDALSHDAYRRRLRRYAQNWQNDSGYAWFAFRNEDDQIIGGITMSNIRRGVVQSASIGYWIGEPHAAQGYMTQIIHLLLPFAFDHLGLHRLEAACLPNNEPSKRLLERTGFEREGLARKYLCIAGQWRDHVLYAQLGEDWRTTQWRRNWRGKSV